MAIRFASWARPASSQKIAGSPVARARRDGQLDPVADRHVLGLAHPPDVAGADRVLEERLAGLVDDAHRAGGGDLEGLVVGAVLLRRLRHQPDVRHRAHGGRVVGAVGAAVVDDDLVDPRVRRVGDHGERVGLVAVGAPHVAAGADHRRHRGVDDHVARHVQVGDALVGVDHRQGRALGDLRLDGGLDLGALRQRLDALEDAAETVVRRETRLGERVAVLREQPREEGAHHVAEDDRVGDLHHRGLEVHREQHALVLGPRHLGGEELAQRGDPHRGGVDDLAGQHRDGLAQHRGGAVVADELDAQAAVGLDDGRLLVGAEVVGGHVRDVGLGVRGPGAHRVRVVAGVVLHRLRRAPVGVALAQHRVDRAALDPVVAGAGVLLLVGRRVVRVVGQVVALLLQLGDGRLELRDGGADVRQLDDVGLGRLRQLAQLGERVVEALLLGEPVGELRDHPARERDVAGLDGHAGRGGVGLDDRQEGVRRQQRRLVRVRVDDRRCGRVGHRGSVSWGFRVCCCFS